jgi:adenosylmethionine-8-amino-7-oxononanoate aminotransferase
MVAVSRNLNQSTLDKWDADHAWHPFTQSSERGFAPPLQIEKGEGHWLFDLNGNRYFDGTASMWTNVRGHGNPSLDNALREQLDCLAHSTFLGHGHPTATLLSRKLAEISPSALEVAFFSDNGSCAVEVALKMSFQFWQLIGRPEKQKVVAMEGAYHGDTFGAMSVGGGGFFAERFRPWCFEVEHFPAPLCLESSGIIHQEDSTSSLDALQLLLDREGDKIAALILEPSVQGAAGMKQQPSGFLQAVAQLCQKADVHLILDEVFVGFGRLGEMLVCSDEGVQPDFLCLAKGLTGGYLPLAATMTTSEVYAAFSGAYHEHKALYHGHTFTANPLAAAVALRNVEMLEEDLAQGLVAEGTKAFGYYLNKTLAKHPNVREVRQRGLACCLDLCPDKDNSNAFPVTRRAGLEVCMEARARGVLLRPLGNSIPLVPPILVRPDELEFLCHVLRDSLDANFAKEQKS